MNKGFIENIGLEVSKNTETEIILKRVLKQRTEKKRDCDEKPLPRLSIHCFDDKDLQQLQEIAVAMSSRIMKKRENNISLARKIIASLKR